MLSHIVYMHLFHGLEEVISPPWAYKLTEEEAISLVAEPVELQRERAHYEDQLARLKQGSQILKDMSGP